MQYLIISENLNDPFKKQTNKQPKKNHAQSNGVYLFSKIKSKGSEQGHTMVYVRENKKLRLKP